MTSIFFDVLELNLGITVVVLILGLLSGKLRKRYGAGCMKWLWMLLAVRLLIPYNFSLPNTEIRLFDSSAFAQEENHGDLQNRPEGIGEDQMGDGLFHEGTDTQTVPANPKPPVTADDQRNGSLANVSPAVGDQINAVTSGENAARNPDVGETQPSQIEQEEIPKQRGAVPVLLASVWLIGFCASGLYHLVCLCCFFLNCRRNLQAVPGEETRRQITALQKKLISRVLPVFTSRRVTSPMLIDVVHPKMVLPISMDQWDDEELELIVAHELTHYQNRDILLKWILTAVCCVNWFNPAVHWMRRQCFYEMELACDGKVLAERNDEERELYARLMLSFAGSIAGAVSYATGFSGSKRRMRNRIDYVLGSQSKRKGTLLIVLTLTAVLFMTSLVSCGYQPEETGEMILPSSSAETGTEPTKETIDPTQSQEELTSAGNIMNPDREDVLAAREKALEGMTDEEIARLRENIKVANLTMERAYLNDNLFEKLSKKDSPYWQYFDHKGEIQLGWWYKRSIVSKESIMYIEGISEEEFAERYTEPGIVYNRFDAENFITLIADMQVSVNNEKLRTDLQQLIDLARMAKLTHEMEYANAIYKILHDMDYFLLRYGIDDVLPYVKDGSTVEKYYGVLFIYGAEPFLLDPQNISVVGKDHTLPGTVNRNEEQENSEHPSYVGQQYLSQIEKRVAVPGTDICYAMYVADAALGSRLYGLLKSTDGGANWYVHSTNPFQDASGGSVEFTFLDESFGFAALSHNGGDEATLYVTEDGGQAFCPVPMLGNPKVTLTDGTQYEPYDYPQMPYYAKDQLVLTVGQGADGDYDGGDRNKLARFVSVDHGKTFVFLDYVTSTRKSASAEKISFAGTVFTYEDLIYDISDRVPGVNAILSCTMAGKHVVIDGHIGPKNGAYLLFNTETKQFEDEIYGSNFIWYDDDITTAVYAFWNEIHRYDGSLVGTVLMTEDSYLYDLEFAENHSKVRATIMTESGDTEEQIFDL